MSFTSRFTILAAFFLALFNAVPSYAIITRFTAPTKLLNPGQHVTVTFYTENHIIQNLQYYIAFGLSEGPVPSGVLGDHLMTGYDLVENVRIRSPLIPRLRV